MNKFFNNRYAVGFFVLVAAVVVYFNFFRRPAPPKTTTPLPTDASSVPAKASAKTTSPGWSQALAVVPIDLTQLDWGKHQLSDPFKRTLSVAEEAQRVAGAASDILKLTGIWGQTGRRFAVINDKVVGEGETVKGYNIQAIENDSVQVLSSRGLERVGFKSATPRPASQPIPTSPPASSPRQARPRAKYQ